MKIDSDGDSNVVWFRYRDSNTMVANAVIPDYEPFLYTETNVAKIESFLRDVANFALDNKIRVEFDDDRTRSSLLEIAAKMRRHAKRITELATMCENMEEVGNDTLEKE